MQKFKVSRDMPDSASITSLYRVNCRLVAYLNVVVGSLDTMMGIPRRRSLCEVLDCGPSAQ